MFTVEDRDRVREYVLSLARDDERVVAGAEVGSLALGGGDRWSDLDLTFGIAEGHPLEEVLDDWKVHLARHFDAVHLFDLSAAPSVYRVFMMAEGLQLDVSVTPAADFRPTSPRFKLLFGNAGEPTEPQAPSRDEPLGWAVLWARFALVCIERGNLWHAEYSIAQLRFRTLEAASLRLGLPSGYGRGLDDLPDEVRDPFTDVFVSSLETGELRGALKAGINGLLAECVAAGDGELIQQRLQEIARDVAIPGPRSA